MEINQLIKKCLKNDRKSQKDLYQLFAPKMKAVCLRYLYDKFLAEEVMNQGFLKVFQNLKKFKNKGSFEGWIRRIMVNQCLDQNRAKARQPYLEEIKDDSLSDASNPVMENDELAFILKVIETLPIGLRTVFNMIEIDGFSHKEVAIELCITESASRSQLTKAKKILREKLKMYNV